MLNVYFYIATGLSFLWAMYSFTFINGSVFISGNANIGAIYSAIMVFLLPIIAIWGFVALLKMLLTERNNKEYVAFLMEQVRKSNEATTTLQQTLLNMEKNINSSFVLQEFNMLVADINEVLSDIIKRSNSVSSAQLEHLWSRTAGGERWLMAKTFIEINNYQSNFVQNILDKAMKNVLLKGSILEFYHCYQNLSKLMKYFDKDRLFSDTIEFGALGKVYSILTPVFENICSNKTEEVVEVKVLKQDNLSNQYDLVFPSFLTQQTVNEERNVVKNDEVYSVDSNLEAIRDELLSSKQDDDKSKLGDFSKTKQAISNLKKQTNKKMAKKIISIEELEEEINASPENCYYEDDFILKAINDDKNN